MYHIREFTKKHKIIFLIISALTLLGLLAILTLTAKHYVFIKDASSICRHILLIAFTILLIKLLGLGDIGFHKNGILKGLILGWYIVVFLLICFFGNDISQAIIPSIGFVILTAINTFLTGFFEESLFRGLILNKMMQKWGECKKGILLSVLFSSVLFGMFHFVNLFFEHQMLSDTIVQASFAAFAGVFFAAIYLRSRNIWPVIILHGFYDWIQLLLGFSFPSAPTVSSFALAVFYFAIIIPFLLIGLYLLRKIKPAGKRETKPVAMV